MKKIFSTTFTKIIISAIGLIITLINSRILGASGLGTVSLIVLTISIILIFNEIIAGGVLVYFIPRYSSSQILIPTYLWSCINIIFFSVILKIIPILDTAFHHHVLLLSLILSLNSVNSMFLLGKQKIGSYNLVVVLQFFSQLIALIWLFFILNQKEVLSVIYALYFGYLVAFITGLILVIKNTDKLVFKNIFIAMPSMFKLGFFAQIGNIAQMLNYRLSYYLIKKYLGLHALGRYTISTQLSESAWLVSRSVALVNYSDIANSNDINKLTNRTITYAKLVLIMSILIMTIMITIPSSIYQFILGKDFTKLQPVLLLLMPGIVILSSCQILATYFSGVGKIHINMYGSVIGLVITTLSALLLIPRLNIYGAALSATLSYLSTTIYTYIMFCKHTKKKLSDFLIRKSDILYLKASIKQLIKIKNQRK